MSYHSIKAKRQIERLAANYRSDQIRNFATISYGVAVGSGFVFLMGFTVGYPNITIPFWILVITLITLGTGRAISLVADLPRSFRFKVKRFFRKSLRIVLGYC